VWLLAFLKGTSGDYISVRPIGIKKIVINDNNEDILERYSYEVDVKSGNYIWTNNEFTTIKSNSIDKLSIDFEYNPLVLTLLRINMFLKSSKKNMSSVLCADIDNQTAQIISKEALLFTFSESSEVVIVNIKKIGRFFEHNIIFSNNDYQNYFNISLKVDKKGLVSFYKDLLIETNNFRLTTLPLVIDSLTDMKDLIDKRIKIIPYDEIKEIKDEYFDIYGLDLSEFVNEIDASEDLKEFVDYLYFMKENGYDEKSSDDLQDQDEQEDDEVEVSFIIDDIEDLESEIEQILENAVPDAVQHDIKAYDTDIDFNDILAGIEEDFMEIMDNFFFSAQEEEKEEIIEELIEVKDKIYTYSKKNDTKEEFEKKLIVDLINAYGIEEVNKNIKHLKEIFSAIEIDGKLENYYDISEEKKINEYKNWYRKIFSKKGTAVSGLISKN
jgi:hypothetical protein